MAYRRRTRWALEQSVAPFDKALPPVPPGPPPRTHLPGVEVEQLIDAEPMLLKADMPGVLQNARRLLPKADPVGVIVSHPHVSGGREQGGEPC